MASYTIATGARAVYAITVTNPSPPGPDGDGGYTTTPPVSIVPTPLIGSVRDATARDLERFAAGTVVSMQARIVMVPFHPAISTQSVLAWTDRAGRGHTANVTGVNNPDGRDVDLVLLAAEVVP